MKSKILPMDDLVFLDEIYPRNQADWMVITSYTENMRSGAKFPPISVIKKDDKYVVVDGKHRYEANRKLNEKYIEAEVLRNWIDEKDAYVEAVKRNITHGKVFSFQEKLQIVQRLERYKISSENITKLVYMKQDTIQRFQAKRVTRAMTGEEVVLKSNIEHLKNIPDRDIPENINDNIPPLRTQELLLNNIINMFKKRLFDESKDTVLMKIGELYNILKENYDEKDFKEETPETPIPLTSS